MEGISDIQIIGIDDKRPPRIRKEPYIDLFFRLSHQAPGDWCSIFNVLLGKHASNAKIKVKEGLFIEAWVQKPEDIPLLLALLKDKVAECSRLFIELIGSVVIHLLWIAFDGTDTILTIPLGEGLEISSLWLATAISLASAVAIFRTV